MIVWSFTCEEDNERLIAEFLNWYMPFSLDVIRSNLVDMKPSSFLFTDNVRCQKFDDRIMIFSSYSISNEEIYLPDDQKFRIETSYVLSIIDNAKQIISETRQP